MSERMEFVLRLEAGERMSELCEEYGISRKTGYKFQARYEALGPVGLYDVTRRPMHSPTRTAESTAALIVAMRREHDSWGPDKLLKVLRGRHPELKFPASTTTGEILKRAGLVKPRRRRRRVAQLVSTRREAHSPNDVWAADYKGEFRLGNGRYCYPLTITDEASRFIVACEGFERIDGEAARTVFEDRFARYGLPQTIRTDNGAPFASRGLFGLTRLSAFWLKVGVTPERIEPGKPHQNGRHERMHRTLKQETTRPAGENLLQQQERFDRFVATFNEKRPHEALGQETPASVYEPSKRCFDSRRPLEYPLHDDVRKVDASGHFRLLRQRKGNVFLSYALANEPIGIRELADKRWLLTFASLDLGHIDAKTMTFQPADEQAFA